MNSGEIAKILNVEFNTFHLLFKKQLPKISSADQALALKWVNSLKDPTLSLEDLKLRNKFIAELIMQMQTGALVYPFNVAPRYRSLDEIQLPSKTTPQEVFPKDFKLAHDYGAFLVTSPIPKCGAFCYLAVVGRPAGNK